MQSLENEVGNGTIQPRESRVEQKRVFVPTSEIFDDYRKRRRQE